MLEDVDEKRKKRQEPVYINVETQSSDALGKSDGLLGLCSLSRLLQILLS